MVEDLYWVVVMQDAGVCVAPVCVRKQQGRESLPGVISMTRIADSWPRPISTTPIADA